MLLSIAVLQQRVHRGMLSLLSLGGWTERSETELRRHVNGFHCGSALNSHEARL